MTVLVQVPSQVEIVVADGNSTDNTLHEAHRLSDELQAQHVRMRYVGIGHNVAAHIVV